MAGAVAIGAAVVWTSEFPFADAAIGQTLEPADGPTGPTGPTGTTAPTGATGSTTTTPTTTATTVPGGPSDTGASGASGAGGENLATTGMDPTTLGAVGAAAALPRHAGVVAPPQQQRPPPEQRWIRTVRPPGRGGQRTPRHR